MTYKNDVSICPLCQQRNRCNVNANNGCWCMNTKVPEVLLVKIPPHLKNISCVCNNCIELHYEELKNNSVNKAVK